MPPEFKAGLNHFLSALEKSPLSTGCRKLDDLLGGVKPGLFYLIYGDDAVEELFSHILVEALQPREEGEKPRAAYMLCGNYRVEKTLLDAQLLMELLEREGIDPEEGLKRIYVLTAFSLEQQLSLADKLEKLLEGDPSIRLVLVRDIAKLARDDLAGRPSAEKTQLLQGAIQRIARACAEAGIPLIASTGSASGEPEGGSFLRHLASVILQLKPRGKGLYRRAILLKHPSREPSSIEYSYGEVRVIGRSTPPTRASFEELVSKLRKSFKAALIDEGRQEAFEKMVEAWSGELGALTYAESFTLLDLLLLTAALENRSLLEQLLRRVEALEEQRDA
jgi:RecA/RadA recombinase